MALIFKYSIPDLETFVVVARRAGISPAADQLGISPATASHRISKLEAALKLKLFHRNSRSFALTDEGLLFFERVEPVLEELRQAETDAGAGQGNVRGHLRVTMSPWILSRFLMPLLPGFRARWPDLTMEFLAVDRFVSLVEEGQDCAIRVGQLPDSALKARRVADNSRIICAAPAFLQANGHPQTVEALMREQWVCLPWQMRFSFKGQDGRPREMTCQRNVLVSNSDMLTEAAVSGLGLAVKSRLAVQEELRTGQLVEVMPQTLYSPHAPVWFVTAHDTRSSRKTRVFSDFVDRAFSAY